MKEFEPYATVAKIPTRDEDPQPGVDKFNGVGSMRGLHEVKKRFADCLRTELT